MAQCVTVEAYNRGMRKQAMRFSFNLFGALTNETHVGCVTEGTVVRQLLCNSAVPTSQTADVSIVGECDRTGRTTRYPATVSTDQRSGVPSPIEE